MVAVNRTFLAFSLASLSLADAAVVPSPPASPSKPGPEPSSLPSIVPLPMKRMVRERANSTPKKSRFLKSRVEEVTTPLGAAFSKRQQDQARFDVHNVPRQVEEREDKGQGHVDITSPTADGNSTRIASLLYNSTTDNLDASPDRYSTMYMVSNDPHDAQDSMPVTLQMPITNSTDGTTSSYCATFDPSPPAPEPLTMTPCFTNSTAPTPHRSQTFVYNASSSVVQPMWNGTDSSVSQRDVNSRDVTLVWVQQQVQQQQEASASSSSASFAASSSSTTSASSSMAASTSASFPVPSKPSAPIAAPPKPSAPVGLQEFSSISATSSFVASSSQASSTASATSSSQASSASASSSQASSASSSSAATPGAFEVHLASSSTGSISSSTDTPPSASSSTTDAASIAAEIAQSSSSSSTSDAGPTAAAEQTVNVAARDTSAMEWKREHGL